MLAFSAADAISPAIQRTKIFLFRPFRLTTYLKLCLVAILTEGGSSGNFNTSNFGRHSSHRRSGLSASTWNLASPHFSFTPLRIAELVAMSLLVMLFCFFLFYLITRLRFAYFHCLIHNVKEIRPGWRLYQTQATRFFWFNVVVGLCFLLLFVLIAIPFAAAFWGLFKNIAAGGHPSLGSIFALLLPLVPIIFLMVFLAIAVDIILRDLMLPHYALENATAGQAWSAVWARIMREKGAFFVYALLRVILPIVAAIAVLIVLIIPIIIFVAVAAVVVVALHAAFSAATGATAFIGIFLEVLIGVVATGIGIAFAIGLAGPVSTAVRQYALMFYGGRYQPLGDILFPPPPPMPPPTPGPIAPELA
jgi:hypothetical protein